MSRSKSRSLPKTVVNWTSTHVSSWLQQKGYNNALIKSFEQHIIDGRALSMLTEQDLREMAILIGIRKNIMHSINQLCQNNSAVENYVPSSKGDSRLCESKECQPVSNQWPTVRHRNSSSFSDYQCGDLEPELFKVGLSFLYVFFVMGITAFVMVIAHERLPDMSKYPPLPDLLLDNLPLIPWAFEAAETVGVILLVIWLVILVFHRHRFIILRRFFALTGTVFLLRSVTMLITSLSVPGQHLHAQCKPFVFNSLREKFERAKVIWLGFGMTLQGVQTCGDYMFSGHTVVLTLVNFFITEYTPRSLYQLHIVAWVLNLFGIFFILAAHEHYSIDVFVAFYIASRLFLYYHCLANNSNLMKRDQTRARVWFPLFSFFENKTKCVVPNEFELPFKNQILYAFSKLKSL